VGLLGRNGVGKTTLMKIAMGLLHPQVGTVRVFGMSPVERPVEVKRRIGYVAEDLQLRGGGTVGELIRFHQRIFSTWDDALQRSLMDRFELSPKARITQLSKGQTRQVALLCAVCHRPELLLLDEPAGGLDPAARREFLEASIELLNREGTSILFSSHHMSDVERIGRRVVLLDNGSVALDRDIESVREEICIAIVPRPSSSDPGMIERIPGCLRVRTVYDSWHAVVEGSPETVHERFVHALRQDEVHCERVPLEELFIE